MNHTPNTTFQYGGGTPPPLPLWVRIGTYLALCVFACAATWAAVQAQGSVPSDDHMIIQETVTMEAPKTVQTFRVGQDQIQLLNLPEGMKKIRFQAVNFDVFAGDIRILDSTNASIAVQTFSAAPSTAPMWEVWTESQNLTVARSLAGVGIRATISIETY